MKHNILSLLAIGALLLLGITSCDQCKQDLPAPQQPITPQPNPFRPPSELPPATQHGANTFGCRINGENWVFWIPPFALTDDTSFQVSEDGDTKGWAYCDVRVWRDTLVAERLIHNDLIFSFSIPFFEPKTYFTSTGNNFDDGNFNFSLLIYNQGKYYYPDTGFAAISNRLIIDRIDQDSNIIAGRFNLVLYRGDDYEITDRGDSIVISDGRFDFIYE